NNPGSEGQGLGKLFDTRQGRRLICSYAGENAQFARQYMAGEVEVEFNPQGTLAERIRAGGAGIPAFYTRTGVGTVIAEGKPTAEFDGRTYLLARALRADLALVHAWQADTDDELDRLSAREREVMRLIARGFSYKEVAAELFISIKTVETHVSAVLRKLQLSSRHELTAWALERKLL
ncbi:MAG TPA: CoA-transferase, partial [Terrimesophilobacter sp.]|nr:CoA-transferase [Terrimesophilobacter sp.]